MNVDRTEQQSARLQHMERKAENHVSVAAQRIKAQPTEQVKAEHQAAQTHKVDLSV